ncbi:hypothetical protein ACVBEF_20515, partial [Glaciimonas sp. GG7]
QSVIASLSARFIEHESIVQAESEQRSTKVIRVAGINKARIKGSFMISTYATIAGKKLHLGTEAVLSRWNVKGCANCQTHLETKAFISLHKFSDAFLKDAQYEVEVHTRDSVLTPTATANGKQLFHFDVK